MYKRVFFGEVVHENVAQLKDINGINTLVFVLLAIPIIVIGVYPNPMLNMFHATIGHILQIADTSRL